MDETKIISVDPKAPFDQAIFDEYDICITGAALKQYQHRPSWIQLVQHTWVYSRVSPAHKEFILTTLRELGYTTLMAGDGTNDVGALKQAHVGVALLDGSPEDLKAIAENQKNQRLKAVYEQQCKISARFNQAHHLFLLLFETSTRSLWRRKRLLSQTCSRPGEKIRWRRWVMAEVPGLL